MAGLTAFDEEAKKAYGKAFTELSEEKQTEFVKKTHDEAINAKAEKRPFILKVKELTMLGFFTSKPGAEQVLQYVAVPGSYKGCIPLKEAGNGKTWAT